MKWTRWAIPLLVLSAALVALAQSGPEGGAPETLLGNLAVGDQITLRTVRDGDSYRISVLTDEELAAAREREEKYAAEREQYDAQREQLREFQGQYMRERSPEKREELSRKLRSLRPPTRPDPVYRVFVVGKDYVGAVRENDELLVPVSSIREIRRRTARPES